MRGFRLWWLAVVMLVIGGSPSFARFFPPSVRVTPSSVDGHALLPVVAGDGRGRAFVVWLDSRNRRGYDVYFNRSADGGVTWQPEDLWLDAAKDQEGGSAEPGLALDGKGGVFVIWKTETKDGVWAIRFRQSLDHGTTWPLVTPRLNPLGGGVAPQIAVDSTGHVYVAWFEKAGPPPAAPPSPLPGLPAPTPFLTNFQIYFATSADAGKTWSSPVRLDHGTTLGAAWFPRLSSDNTGHVYVVWKDPRHETASVYFNTSSDYGKTWLAHDLRLDHSPNDAEAPQIASDQTGHLYVVWHDLRSGRHDIYFNRSTDHGKTWLAQDVRLSRPATMAGASLLQATNDGRVYVVWADPGRGHYDLVVRVSSDYGRTWREEIRLDHDSPKPGNSFFPQMASDEAGRVAVVWEDHRNPRPGIYLNYSVNSGRTWLKEEMRVDADTAADFSGLRPGIALIKGGTTLVAWEVTRAEEVSRESPRDIRVRVIQLAAGSGSKSMRQRAK